jgi:enoyl-[acyl-carrier protein] reductase II
MKINDTKIFKNNKICNLFNLKYPFIQAGMVWVSGAKLASACANSGILGIIGAGSMNPELLESQIKKAKKLSPYNFDKIAVNIPLLYPKAKEQIDISIKNGIKIFFTSAGSPKKFANHILNNKCKFIHVVSSPEHAVKAKESGASAVVAEGFEAGGHNGINEITTLCLIPQVRKVIDIPLIAAGGIGSGSSIVACMALGADGVQIGTRFVTSLESSAHDNFKNEIIKSKYDSTKLVMKNIVPVRLLKNEFCNNIINMESTHSTGDIRIYLGKGRAKNGMHLGDIKEGELEIGQVCGLINKVQTAKEIIKDLSQETLETLKKLQF